LESKDITKRKGEHAMYENPKLNRIGNAQDVVLGIADNGEDLDYNWIPGPHDYAPDNEPDVD
jgi:hypothetical protein